MKGKIIFHLILILGHLVVGIAAYIHDITLVLVAMILGCLGSSLQLYRLIKKAPQKAEHQTR
jgi:Flp pilus assembly protein TadB